MLISLIPGIAIGAEEIPYNDESFAETSDVFEITGDVETEAYEDVMDKMGSVQSAERSRNISLLPVITGVAGANITWELDTVTGLLTIIGTGNMTNWSWGASPWFAYRNSITGVNISNGVTSIGNHAFFYCTSLTSIEIPNGVTSIRSQTFYGCTGLTSVIIPNSVTTIRDQAFQNCISLTAIAIPSNITIIGRGAFWGCTNLVTVMFLRTVPPNFAPSAFFEINNTITAFIPIDTRDAYTTALAGQGNFRIMETCIGRNCGDCDVCNPIIDPILTPDDLEEIKNSDKVFKYERDDGIVIRIDPDSFTGETVSAFNLEFEILFVEEVTEVGNTSVPENSIIISPGTHGNFGFAVTITISNQQLDTVGLSGDEAQLFYIADDGEVTEYETVTLNADGSVTFVIDHSSSYSLQRVSKGLVISASRPPTIMDALEILKFLVNMPSAITRDARARTASLITTEAQMLGRPSIMDALEILKYLVGMPGILRN
jgi:hypothetical protein